MGVRRLNSPPLFVSADAGHRSHGPAGELYITRLQAPQTSGALSLCEIRLPPGGGPPLHRHTREDEIFIIVEGRVSFIVDGRIFEADPGATLFAPRNVPHTFKNRGTAPARLLVLLTPPGGEELFHRFGAPDPRTGTPPADELIVERILKLAPEFGIELLGPSPL